MVAVEEAKRGLILTELFTKMSSNKNKIKPFEICLFEAAAVRGSTADAGFRLN